MKILFAIVLLVAFVVTSHAQSKVMAENVRSSEKVVKNAPFSAETVSESIQVLADGNRIVRKTTSRMYRDTEGRFRREDMPKQIGIPGTVVETPESITIVDPIAGFKYVLDTKRRIARQSFLKQPFELRHNSESRIKMELKKVEVAAKRAEKEAERKAKAAIRAEKMAEVRAKRAARSENDPERVKEIDKQTRKPVPAKVEKVDAKKPEKPVAVRKAEPEKKEKDDSKTESLGVQNIEGIAAEGTRTTTTISAGAVGNERAIEIVYEKWFSKDLQMMVRSRHNDPRFGEQTYRLTNISRREPSTTLFSPPADYRIIEAKGRQPKPVLAPKVPSNDAKPPAKPAPQKGQ